MSRRGGNPCFAHLFSVLRQPHSTLHMPLYVHPESFCDICGNTFDLHSGAHAPTVPCALPCGHVFCRKCAIHMHLREICILMNACSCLMHLRIAPNERHITSIRDCPICRERFSRDCLKALIVHTLPSPSVAKESRKPHGVLGRPDGTLSRLNTNVGDWMRKGKTYESK